MANTCSIELTILFGSLAELEQLSQYLHDEKCKADKQNVGLYVGSQRYLFGTKIQKEGDVLKIWCWVKWGFNDDEVVAFLHFLQLHAKIESFVMAYEECGCLLYGRVTYEQERLTDLYIPDNEFPDDDGTEFFIERLEQHFQNHWQERKITLL